MVKKLSETILGQIICICNYHHINKCKTKYITRVLEVGVFIAYFLAGNEVVSIPVQRYEGCHVVFTVVTNWCIGCGVVRLFWLVPSQPLLIDAKETDANSKKPSFTKHIRLQTKETCFTYCF